jgi:N-acetylglucosaminyldiphosphoundecaprenol N-acetyl-beta-D-mannosaminyltransferase
MSPTPARIGALRLAPLTLTDAVEWIAEQARTGRPCLVVTSNIHHLRLADTDTAFADVVARAELNLADGWPLVAATKLASDVSVPERVAGVDLVDRILTQSDVALRVAILGGPPGAAERLARRVHAPHEVVYVDELPKGRWDTPPQLAQLLERLAAARPSLTLVGIGAPRQELLADALRPALAGPAIGCGAAVEILAGLRPRAPRLVQAVRLEWVFRMLLEPRRLAPRYWVAGRTFVAVVVRQMRAGRRPR